MSKKRVVMMNLPTVTIPRHEYAMLIAAKAKLDIVERLVMEPDRYMYLHDVPRLLFTPRTMEEDFE